MSIDVNSPTWSHITEWAQKRHMESMVANARPGTPEREADWHRGRIALASELLSLPKHEMIENG